MECNWGGLLGKLVDRVDLEWGWCCGVVRGQTQRLRENELVN